MMSFPRFQNEKQWLDYVAKYNENHEPAGSSDGGQFAESDTGSGSGASKPAGKPGTKPVAAKPAAKPSGSGKGGDVVVFHGSQTKAIDSIRKNGLTVKGNKRVWHGDGIQSDLYQGDRGHSVFVVQKKFEAHEWAERSADEKGGKAQAIVFEIHIPKGEAVKITPDEEATGTTSMYKGNIPAAWITGYQTKVGMGKWSKMQPFHSATKAAEADGVTFYAAFLLSGTGD